MNDSGKMNRFLNYRTLIVAIVFLYLVSLVKRIFVGFDMDEQYSVALLYRIASGDLLLKEMWEPHQTSAIVLAPLVKAYMAVKGDTEYLMVFLRLVGALIQALIAVLWCRVVARKTERSIAAFSAAIILFVLPKWIQSPEFTNMQVWMLITTCVCLIAAIEKNSFGLAIVAGAFFTLEVLDYPSCVLLIIVFVIFLRKDLKKLLGMLIVPIASFVAFVTYLLSHMSVNELFASVSHILSDGSHSEGFRDKIIKYISELPQLAVHVLIYALIGVAVSLLWHVLVRKKKAGGRIFADSLCICSAVALLDQFRFWFSDGAHIVHPQYGYFVLFAAGIILYIKDRDKFDDKWSLWVKLIYTASFVGFLSVLALTNLDIRASFVHLLPGMIMSVVLLAERYKSSDARESRIMMGILLVSISMLFLFGQICVVRTSNEGRYEDMRFVRQKSLYGASKGIYCAYMEGYESNDNYLLLKQNMPDGSKLLYVGVDNATYLMGNYVVCEPSTISTPVYEGLEDYYTINRERIPEYIVFDKSFVDKSSIDKDDIFDMAGGVKAELLAESDFIEVYRTIEE